VIVSRRALSCKGLQSEDISLTQKVRPLVRELLSEKRLPSEIKCSLTQLLLNIEYSNKYSSSEIYSYYSRAI
jgi:hypothetical protein